MRIFLVYYQRSQTVGGFYKDKDNVSQIVMLATLQSATWGANIKSTERKK